MPSRSRSQASIDASKARAPSRASSRTALAPKVRSYKTEKASTRHNRTQPEPPASPDTSQTPPPALKRSRSTATFKEVNGVNGAAKALKKTKTVATVAVIPPQPKRTRKVPSESELSINAVPSFPVKMNPPAQIFVWGTGNFGQFGMGPSYLDEVSKPTRNTWVEEKMAQGVFGSGPGSGIVGVAAGGLHSLFIDENGTVCSFHCDLLNAHHLT